VPGRIHAVPFDSKSETRMQFLSPGRRREDRGNEVDVTAKQHFSDDILAEV
jgi:hypothetical protein